MWRLPIENCRNKYGGGHYQSKSHKTWARRAFRHAPPSFSALIIAAGHKSTLLVRDSLHEPLRPVGA